MIAAAAPISNTVVATVPSPRESAAPAFATLSALYCGGADEQSQGLLGHSSSVRMLGPAMFRELTLPEERAIKQFF